MMSRLTINLYANGNVNSINRSTAVLTTVFDESTYQSTISSIVSNIKNGPTENSQGGGLEESQAGVPMEMLSSSGQGNE